MEIFENAVFICSGGRMKTEHFRNAYVVWYPALDMKWWTEISLLCHLFLGFLSSLIAYLEINQALLNAQADCIRRMLNIRLLHRTYMCW